MNLRMVKSAPIIAFLILFFVSSVQALPFSLTQNYGWDGMYAGGSGSFQFDLSGLYDSSQYTSTVTSGIFSIKVGDDEVFDSKSTLEHKEETVTGWTETHSIWKVFWVDTYWENEVYDNYFNPQEGMHLLLGNYIVGSIQNSQSDYYTKKEYYGLVETHSDNGWPVNNLYSTYRARRMYGYGLSKGLRSFGLPDSVFTSINPLMPIVFDYSMFGDMRVYEATFSGELELTSIPDIDDPNDNPVPTPEPGTMMLFGSGLVFLAGLGRKKEVCKKTIEA